MNQQEFMILLGCYKTTRLVLTILVILSNGVLLRISVWKRTIGIGTLAQTVLFQTTRILHGLQAAAVTHDNKDAIFN